MECMSRDEMRELQSEKLKKIVAATLENTEFDVDVIMSIIAANPEF